MAAIIASLNKPDASLESIQASVVQIITLLEQHNLTGAETATLKTGDMASPPALGGTIPNDGNFSRIRATGATPNPALAGFRYSGFGPDHFISTTPLTGATTLIALPGDARYARLALKLRGVLPTTNADDLWMRVNAGSGVDVGANYVSNGVAFAGAGALNTRTTDTHFFLTRADGVSNTATKGLNGWIQIDAPGDTTHHKPMRVDLEGDDTTSAGLVLWHSALRYIGAATALTQLQLLWRTGGASAGGAVDLYGELAI